MMKWFVAVMLCLGLAVPAFAHGPRGVRASGFSIRTNGFRVNSFQTRQFDRFGTRTFVDRNGNLFEEDFRGNFRFLGNVHSRGFSGRGFVSGGANINVFIDD